jgi:glycerophosphoryl diester phosphodiesterase
MRRLRYLPCILTVLLASCSKDPPLWKIENLNNNEIQIFGHGGMGIFSLYPLDSRESIAECLKIGADGSEMDIQMSKDSVLFVFHSDDLAASTSCNGSIADKNSDGIVCTYNSIAHNGIEVSRLSTLFEQLDHSNNQVFTFECKLTGNKDADYYNHFSNALVRHITEFHLEDFCLIESTDLSFIKILKSKNKDLKLFLYTNDFASGLESASDLGLYGLTLDMKKITKEQVAQAHAKNLHVTLFNQQTQNENLEAVRMSPDFIQTDKLEHLLKVFGKYK